MTLPNLPLVAQVNWLDSDQSPPWSDASCNLFATKLRHADFEVRAFRGSLRSETATLQFHDPDGALVPSKASSVLAPNVVLGRRVRLLRQTALGSGLWEPWWFGYIRDFTPRTTKQQPFTTTLLADGPLAALATQDITLSPSLGAVVWDADDPYHTGLWHLLQEAGLWGSPFLQLDNVGAVTLPDDWAGTGAPDIADPANWQTKTFGEWLGILCKAADCFMVAVPQFAVADGDPDFTLHWYQTSPGAATDFALDATDGDLELTPQLSYSGEFFQ